MRTDRGQLGTGELGRGKLAPPRPAATAAPASPSRRRRTRARLVLVTALVVGGLAGWNAWGDARLPSAWSEGVPEPSVLGAEVRPEDDDGLAAGRGVDAGGLDPGLEAALEQARHAAAADGVELPVASGYRSAEEQLALLEREIAERGSRDEALIWVFPPDRSMHVRGLAVDIDAGPGADWLQRHGAGFGLCKTLAWEWWHFEWRQRWQDDGRCPPPATTPDEAPDP